MKITTLFAILVLSAVVAFAQATTPPTPPPGSQTQTGAGAAANPHSDMQGHMKMHEDMGQMHQNMQATVDRFRTMLDKMKADAANLTDPTGKQVAQDNIDMWQAFLDHVQGMAQHMNAPGAGVPRHKHAAPSAKPATPPSPK